jgi:hypothetical protein
LFVLLCFSYWPLYCPSFFSIYDSGYIFGIFQIVLILISILKINNK